MLLRKDETFFDTKLGRLEKVFPTGIANASFQSRLPGAEVFEDSVLDPAIGIAGDLGIASFARAEMTNFAESTKVALYELGTRIGVPDSVQSGAQAVASIYGQIDEAIAIVASHGDDPYDAIPDLIKNAAMSAMAQIAMYGGFVGWAIAAIGSVAIWSSSYATAAIAKSLGKDIALPPLQTVEPATDSFQVNRVFEMMRKAGSGGGIVYPDGGMEAAPNADYTSLFMPAYQHAQPWTFQYRNYGIAAQQGYASPSQGGIHEGMGSPFAVAMDNFGYMPGVGSMLRPLQSSYRYYQAYRASASVDRYSLRCVGIDKPCYQTSKTFDGSKNCRQCVKAESVWPTQGVGWAYAGVPLNATTPGENVGDFYPSTNRLIGWFEQQIAGGGPLLFTIDTQQIYYAWQSTFERFWEFIAAEWHRYNTSGWRGQMSRLGTLMTAFDSGDGLGMRAGGRDPQMPADRVCNPREAPEFDIPFSASIFAEMIAPFLVDVGKLQNWKLDTVDVAYISPGAGAVYSSQGKIRNTALGQKFLSSRQALLSSTKRFAIDLRNVQDPEYREALISSGVKPSPVKQGLLGGQGLLAPDPPKPPRVKPPAAPPMLAISELASLSLSSGGSRQESSRKKSHAPLLLAVAGAAAFVYYRNR